MAYKHNRMDRFHHEMTVQEKVLLFGTNMFHLLNVSFLIKFSVLFAARHVVAIIRIVLFNFGLCQDLSTFVTIRSCYMYTE